MGKKNIMATPEFYKVAIQKYNTYPLKDLFHLRL